MRDRNAPLSASDLDALAWDKMDGLLPAIVQDRRSGRVLMLGYMSREAVEATLDSGLATFFSRSKQRLWQKGETSGNRLHVRSLFADCDGDALLLLADAEGPTCHTRTVSCFGEAANGGAGWLDDTSYTRRLLAEGVPRIAQKVGEEGVEVALAAVTRGRDGCPEEIADLMYHLTVLMQALGLEWDEVMSVLRSRQSVSSPPA
jgi:phosphoribosyl-ATP pyrophosphohydrolase/phosphoribosyl-AMP cyclohydrolase